MTYGPINWINLALGVLMVIIPLFFYLKDFDPLRIAPRDMGATDQTMNTIEQLGVGASLILMYVPLAAWVSMDFRLCLQWYCAGGSVR